MYEFLQAMLLPFLACLLLAGIHVYLGIHVLARKVIFVDLALAQIAALGSVYGVLLGYGIDEHPWHVKAFSLAFTIFGAALFSLTRVRNERVPHEAIIGITYAASLAATILMSSQLAHGADELRELLAGSILWVEYPTLIFTAILYAIVGLFHFAFHRQFLLISENPDLAEKQGLNTRLWDFFFYITFGFVVTSSVSIAGVLLVFSYLVIPAVIATLVASTLKTRLIVGWSVGALVSFFGVVFSYYADLPSGPAIAVVFAAVLAIVALGRFLAASEHIARSLAYTAAGLLALALAVWFSLQIRMENNEKVRRVNINQLLSSKNADERRMVPRLILEHDRTNALSKLAPLLLDPSDQVREEALRVVRELADQRSRPALLKALSLEQDDYLRVEFAEALLELGEKQAIVDLIDIMDDGEVEQVRKDAYEHLSAHVLINLSFDAQIAADKNDEQVKPFRHWWQENQDRLQFDPITKIFKVK